MTPDAGSGTGIAMRFGYRELVTPSMIGLTAGVSVTLLAVVAALGPMDTLKTLTFFQRLAYFGAITACEVPICFGCGFFTLYVMRERPPIQVALALIVMCAVVITPGVGFAAILYPAFHGGDFRQVNYMGIYWFGLLTFGGGSGLVFYVLCERLARAPQSNHRASSGRSAQEPATAAVFESRESTVAPAPRGAPDESHDAAGMQSSTPESTLPDELREHIVYAHVSGHYVEVVTTAGTEVLLMRLSDVARALSGEGMQTHRSYWVAYRHIVRLERIERRAVLHVTGGHKVPVSRSLRSEVLAFMKERKRPPR